MDERSRYSVRNLSDNYGTSYSHEGKTWVVHAFFMPSGLGKFNAPQRHISAITAFI